jgi:signal transduction histidine kinase/CHASE3 domain sensor protein
MEISQTNFKRRLTLALVLPLLLMLLLAGILFGQIDHLTHSMDWVNHTDQVIAQANYTEKLIINQETGVRGYLITGNRQFLEPYQKSRGAIASTFDNFRQLVADNPSQVQRLTKVRSLYNQWSEYAQQMISLKQQAGNYQAESINLQGKQLMDSIRTEMVSFIQTEERLRNNRTRMAQESSRSLIIIGIPLFLSMGVILAFFIQRQLISVAKSYKLALKVAQEREESLRRAAQRLTTVHQIDSSILAAQSPRTIIDNAVTQMGRLIPYQQAFVVSFNFDTNTAEVIGGNLNPVSLPLADFEPEGVLQQVCRYVENLHKNQFSPTLQPLLCEDARSYCAMPLRVEANLIGELYLVSTQNDAFAEEDQAIAKEVADQLAIALQQANLRQQLQNYTTQLEQRVSQRTQELQEVNDELEAFSYSVSHDLRAPLRTLQGFTQALMEDYGDKLDDLGKDYASYIVEAAVSMDRLIADLLAYSRLSRTEIQLQPTDLSRVLSEALKQLHAVQTQAQITIEELPPVMAQYRILVQVLTNLLSNAFKFVEPDVQPQIRVWAQTQENWVRLWVEDNGIGIAPEYQERIFRVFERLHGIEAYPGTGIGLAIVRKGIERLGGRVGVESEPRQGSRFWIDLPKVTKSVSLTPF